MIDEKVLQGARPWIEFIYSLMDEIETKEKELKVVRGIAREQLESAEEQFHENQKLRTENHSMQLFIERVATEEEKKEIFIQSDSE